MSEIADALDQTHESVIDCWLRHKDDAFRYFNAGYRSYRGIRRKRVTAKDYKPEFGKQPNHETIIECTFALFPNWNEQTYVVKFGTEVVEEGSMP